MSTVRVLLREFEGVTLDLVETTTPSGAISSRVFHVITPWASLGTTVSDEALAHQMFDNAVALSARPAVAA